MVCNWVLISSLVAYGSSHPWGLKEMRENIPWQPLIQEGNGLLQHRQRRANWWGTYIYIYYTYIFTLNTPHKPCYSKGSTMIDIYLGPFNPGLFSWDMLRLPSGSQTWRQHFHISFHDFSVVNLHGSFLGQCNRHVWGHRMVNPIQYTLWLFNIAMENIGKWPIYRWFTWVYLLKMVIFHGYVK